MDRDKFLRLVDQKIEQVSHNFLAKGANNNNEPEKLVLFILDLLKKGDFDGIISIKIKDNKIYDPMLSEQKIKLQSTYLNT